MVKVIKVLGDTGPRRGGRKGKSSDLRTAIIVVASRKSNRMAKGEEDNLHPASTIGMGSVN